MANNVKLRQYLNQWGPLVGIGVIAVFYRIWQWRELPPGLASAEAASGLTASAVAHGNQILGFHSSTGYSPLWEALSAGSVLLFGQTISSLRLVSVVLSLIAVVATYGWVKSWYDRRTAGVAALLIAVMPWSITLSRNAVPTIFGMVLLSALLWAVAGIVKSPASSRVAVLTGLVVISMAAGPWGWLAVVITIVAGAFQRQATVRQLTTLRAKPVPSLVFGVIGIGSVIAGALAATRFGKAIFHAIGIGSVGSWLSHTISVISMFFYRGDPNYFHNLGGEPMLNAFIALAFVAGIMVLLSRFQRARDRATLILLVLGLLPAIFSSGTAPNAARAVLALPVIASAAAIGIFYLLDLWTATFPVNSAARSVGLTAISLLLVLSAYQAYTQYFIAWANSSETYVSYNRSAVAASAYAKKLAADKMPLIVSSKEEQSVVRYLLPKGTKAILPDDIGQLGSGQPYYLVITASVHDQALALIEKKLPGGTIKPHLDRDGSELYYDYVITK